jgi:hypothetical protein
LQRGKQKHTADQEEFLWEKNHNKNPGLSGILTSGIHKKGIIFQAEQLGFALCIPCFSSRAICGADSKTFISLA